MEASINQKKLDDKTMDYKMVRFTKQMWEKLTDMKHELRARSMDEAVGKLIEEYNRNKKEA